MQIDPRSHVPVFEQIADGIRRGIAAGVYRPGESLPSLRALALQLRVNPNTVQRAYDALARESLILSRRGMGMFVADRSAESARGQAEAALERSLQRAVAEALAAGLRPAQIRQVFKQCMAAEVSP